MRKFNCQKKHSPELRKESVYGIFYVNNSKLSEKQKKLLHELYLENLRDGLKPKEAMNKAYQIISCFKI